MIFVLENIEKTIIRKYFWQKLFESKNIILKNLSWDLFTFFNQQFNSLKLITYYYKGNMIFFHILTDNNKKGMFSISKKKKILNFMNH